MCEVRGWEGETEESDRGCEWGGRGVRRGVRRVDISESEYVMCVERSELVMY